MSFHTPGPWLHAGPIGAGQYIVSETAPIAVVYGQNTMGTAGANAFLIAAAPELLEALTSMVQRFGGSSVCVIDTIAIGQARSAIAKAEGR